MKNTIYIFLAIMLLSVSCSGLRERASMNEERRLMNRENVKKAIESQQMIVKVNRLHTKTGRALDINPRNNFIIIDRKMSRISLAYMGRSFTTRPVAAINFTGEVYSYMVDAKSDGGYDISIETGQDNDKFRVDIQVSNDGYASLSIVNPRIDFVRYSGNLSLLGT